LSGRNLFGKKAKNLRFSDTFLDKHHRAISILSNATAGGAWKHSILHPFEGTSLQGNVTRTKMFSMSRGATAPSVASSSAFASCSSSKTTRAVVANKRRGSSQQLHATVVINHEGKDYTVEVQDGETILEAGLEAGIDLRHDCKMGVCMMCPAKRVSGEVEQPNAMLSDDVVDQGFVLLCCSEPVNDDVKITTVDEDELLEVQLRA